MLPLKEYHHFREDFRYSFDRVAKYERYIIDLLLKSQRSDSERESSICWELKHQASTVQFAKILALKRNLPIEVCAVGLLLHDINSIIYGTYKNHAHQGSKLAEDIFAKLGGFSDEEKNEILKIIYNHSDKHILSNDPFEEFGKDVDVLDCFLYDGAFDFYLGHKSLLEFKGYLDRAKNIWKELGLPQDIRFNILDGYSEKWFQYINKFSIDSMKKILAILFELTEKEKSFRVCPPPFCIIIKNKELMFYSNSIQWRKYITALPKISTKQISKQQMKSISLILKKVILGRTDIQEIDYHKFTTSSTVENLLTAEHLFENKDDVNLMLHGYLFWPLIDIYEILDGKRLIKRLQDLGMEL